MNRRTTVTNIKKQYTSRRACDNDPQRDEWNTFSTRFYPERRFLGTFTEDAVSEGATPVKFFEQIEAEESGSSILPDDLPVDH